MGLKPQNYLQVLSSPVEGRVCRFCDVIFLILDICRKEVMTLHIVSSVGIALHKLQNLSFLIIGHLHAVSVHMTIGLVYPNLLLLFVIICRHIKFGCIKFSFYCLEQRSTEQYVCN